MDVISDAIVTYKKQILLFHRDNIPHIKDPDCWGLIGGHGEDGESYDQALIREVQEEISVTPSNYTFLMQFEDAWGTPNHLYHIELNDQEKSEIKLGNEGQEVRLFRLEELENLKLTLDLKNLLKNHRDIFEKLLT